MEEKMEIVTILWKNPDFEGKSNLLYPYEIYKFNLPVQEERIIEKYFNKKTDEEVRLNLILNDDVLSIFLYLFGEMSSDCILIYPKKKIQHKGYLLITKEKELIFNPTLKREDKEIEELEKKAIVKSTVSK